MNDFEKPNLRLKKLVIEVVENQMRMNEPPITNQTYNRLIKESNSEVLAKEKIASVSLEHIYYVMHDGKAFDEEKYTVDLNAIK